LGALFFAVLFTLLASREALASTSSDCTSNSGSWSGSDPDVGTCDYPAKRLRRSRIAVPTIATRLFTILTNRSKTIALSSLLLPPQAAHPNRAAAAARCAALWKFA
jgi:hypothetical protein